MFILSEPYKVRVSRPKHGKPWTYTYVFRYSRWWSHQKKCKQSLYQIVSRIGCQENPSIKSRGRFKPNLQSMLWIKRREFVMKKIRRN